MVYKFKYMIPYAIYTYMVKLEKCSCALSSEGILGLVAYYFTDTVFSGRNILDCYDYNHM